MIDAPAVLVLIFWVILILFWLFSAFNAKRNLRRGPSFWIWRLVAVVVIFLITRIPGAQVYVNDLYRFTPIALQWIGAVLTACGVAFAIWARINLGRNWGMPMSLKENAELVTSGPYAYVRHPIYTGFILAALGSCFVTPWWTIPLFAMLVYFVYSATQEEKIMTNEFPNQYPDYMKRSKMLIPFVF